MRSNDPAHGTVAFGSEGPLKVPLSNPGKAARRKDLDYPHTDVPNLEIAPSGYVPSMGHLALERFVYEQTRPEPLGEDTLDMVEGRVFPRSDVALDLLYLVALASERKVEIIDEEHQEQALSRFEAYANGGFAIIDSWLEAHPPDESPIRSLMTDLRRHGFLNDDDAQDGAPEDVVFE